MYRTSSVVELVVDGARLEPPNHSCHSSRHAVGYGVGGGAAGSGGGTAAGGTGGAVGASFHFRAIAYEYPRPDLGA